MKVQVVQYSPVGVEIDTLRSLEDLKPRGDTSQLWLDISEYGKEEELTPLAKAFNLHPLALEDCYNVRQRPKIDEFTDNLFIVARTIFNKDPAYSEGYQLGIFLGKNFLITVHVRPMPQLDLVLSDIRKGEPTIVTGSPSFLLHAILNNVVDNFEESVCKSEDMETDLGAEVLKDPPPKNILNSIYTCRRNLLLVRRFLRPQSDGLERLMARSRADDHLVDRGSLVFLRDVVDHTKRTLDRIDSLLDMNVGTLNIYLSSVSNKMNDAMRLMAAITAIVAIPSVIGSLLGMNLIGNPWPWELWTIGIVASSAAIAMIVYFVFKGWLLKR